MNEMEMEADYQKRMKSGNLTMDEVTSGQADYKRKMKKKKKMSQKVNQKKQGLAAQGDKISAVKKETQRMRDIGRNPFKAIANAF